MRGGRRTRAATRRPRHRSGFLREAPALAEARPWRPIVLTAAAATTPARVPWLPEVPTVAEPGFSGFDPAGFDANVWSMLMGPAGLPRPVAERLAAALLARDAARHATPIRAANIRLE